MIKDTLFYINYTGPHKILSFTKTNYVTLIKIEYADSRFVTQITLAPPDFVLCVRTCLIEPQCRLTWQKELTPYADIRNYRGFYETLKVVYDPSYKVQSALFKRYLQIWLKYKTTGENIF